MTGLHILAAAALPFVAALQRFAVAYGYQGASRAEALESARGVFVIVAAIDCLLILGAIAHG